MVSRLKKTLRNHACRLVSLAVLLLILTSFLPIPTGSSPRNDKDLSQPFPCQNRPCGCRSADQCWKRCCCFTNAQKVSWAKAHNVTPPAYVIAAANGTKHGSDALKGCCKHKADKIGGVATVAKDQLANDQRVKSCKPNVDGDKSRKSATDRQNVNYVIGVVAEQCQGHSSFWSAVPWVILPELATIPEKNLTTTEAVVSHSLAYTHLRRRPPVPPPRCALPVILLG